MGLVAFINAGATKQLSALAPENGDLGEGGRGRERGSDGTPFSWRWAEPTNWLPQMADQMPPQASCACL